MTGGCPRRMLQTRVHERSGYAEYKARREDVARELVTVLARTRSG